MSAPIDHSPRSSRAGRRVFSLLILVGLLFGLRPALAQQAPACASFPEPATISLPQVSIAPGQANGKIGTPAQVSVFFLCDFAFLGTRNGSHTFVLRTGNFAALDTTASPPGGSGVMFATDMPGIDVLLTAQQVQASAGSNGPDGTVGWVMGSIKCTGGWFSCNPTNGFSGSVTFTAQLVKTGPTGVGTVGAINLLGFFDSDNRYSSASAQFGSLVLNATRISANTCSVSMPSANFTVTLPTLGASAFTGPGTTVGTTPFPITYNCPAGWDLAMYMSTATPGPAPGVMLTASSGACSGGGAGNVGVQLLQSDMQPVAFDTYQPLGASPNGPLTLTYYARYYQTGSPVSPGQVCTTATYTMTYQ